MKKTYEVVMNDTGRLTDYARVSFTVQAESEYDATQIALQQYPNKQVISVKER